MSVLQGAVESGAPVSRLHERQSYPADFPVPTGREEEWRFTPLRPPPRAAGRYGAARVQGHRGNRSRTRGRCLPCRTGHRRGSCDPEGWLVSHLFPAPETLHGALPPEN
jgi:hypothetical protein